MKHGEPRHDHPATPAGAEQKTMYGNSMSVGEMRQVLREAKIDPALFPKLNSTDATRTMLHRGSDGALLLSGEANGYGGIRFVYRLRPGQDVADVLYDSNKEGVQTNECLLSKIFGFQLGRAVSASEIRVMLGAFLALSPERVAQAFPRLADFTRETFLAYGQNAGKLSLNGKGQKPGEISFIYSIELTTGRITLDFLNETDPATGERRIYARWNPETYANRPKDAE